MAARLTIGRLEIGIDPIGRTSIRAECIDLAIEPHSNPKPTNATRSLTQSDPRVQQIAERERRKYAKGYHDYNALGQPVWRTCVFDGLGFEVWCDYHWGSPWDDMPSIPDRRSHQVKCVCGATSQPGTNNDAKRWRKIHRLVCDGQIRPRPARDLQATAA